MEILNNEVSFGSKLVNRALQKRFGVSSSPIRDVINRLYQDGLIRSIDTTGATVIDFDYDFFLEVNEVLLYVNNTGVKLSSEKSDINKICTYLKEYIDLQEENIGTDKYFDFDYKFHKTFIDYSKNSRLMKIFKEYNVLHEMLVRNFYKPNTMQIQENGIKTHKKIANAFCKGDYQLAMEFMEEHYKAAENTFSKILEHGSKKDI